MADPQIQQAILDVLSNPMDLPSTFWDYATQNWLKDAPVFPISQVFGFAQFNANVATTVATQETTTSLTYADLATVGPQLTGIPDGKYIVLFGADASNLTAGTGSAMSIQVNATAAADADWALTNQGPNFITVMRAVPKSLSNNGSNTITAKYRVGGSTGTWQNRWLFALRYGNL